ncbi:MAG TPA: sigma-70 family RNA polymerase sigma factor [Bryobacteraceae bacterium]|nr:sigma-70 family RNA polymerase sigma factor [Bryobacteraceae bacterium]
MDLDKDQDIHEHLGAGRYRDAFELLLARYQHKVFRLSWSMLGDQTAAEEMAQDVFLQIWRVLPGYRGEASLSTWIYAITRNRCLTQRKKSRDCSAASIEEPGVLRAAEARLSTRERPSNEADVVALMAQLPPQYRQALTLFYLEEKSYEEVAALLGLPVGTVKTYLHRARKQLAGSLDPLRREASCR